MAAARNLIFFYALLLFTATCMAQKSLRPKTLLLPVSKDSKTLQYLVEIHQRTPLVPVKLTLDLGANFLWVNCEKNYVSSSYKPVRCHSAPCSLANSKACHDCWSAPTGPGCHNNTCALNPINTVGHIFTSGDVTQDVLTIHSLSGNIVSVPHFIFVCGATALLDGLASGVTGMAALGRSKISLPSQFSAAFSFPRKFAVCLSSSSTAKGIVLFGNERYNFLPYQDLSADLIYTPLILNPVSTAQTYYTGDASTDYFIGVESIKINSKVVPLNTTLLSIDNEGNGGTKISTIDPYTVLETSIYEAVTGFFAKELSGVPRVRPVAPFTLCFNSSSISSTRVGPGVPQIDLVLQNSNVAWSIFGANSMVYVERDVLCLGFVDGGINPRTSIVIGAHQIEDNLLEFDLASSRLGFSSSLLFRQITCANFNFSANF